MPPVAAVDEEFCQKVCRMASALEFRIKEERLRGGRFRFVWRTRDGTYQAGPATKDVQSALTRACELFVSANS